MFSKACQYGIKAVIYIGQQSQVNNRVSLRAVAKEIDSPVAFTGKILQLLAKENIVKSVKGARGGYEIRDTQFDTLRLMDIVNAIDGKHIYSQCMLGLDACDDSNPCPAHYKFVAVKKELRHMLKTTTLNELIRRVEGGNTVLRNPENVGESLFPLVNN